MKKQILDDAFRTFIVIISSVIYALGVIWFIEPANLYAAGITGISQLIKAIFKTFFNTDLNLGLLSLLLNVPIFVVGWRRVSTRFAIYSLISVVVTSVLLLGFIPVVDFGISPEGNEITFSIIGGLVTGFGSGLALRYGTSTGGLDIIAQAYAFKKNVSIGVFTMSVNLLVAIIGGGFVSKVWSITFYSVVRIIISSVVVDRLHTIYNYTTLNIITTHTDEITGAIMSDLKRGCTIFPIEGAYTHEKKSDIYTVVSSYEIHKAIKLCQSIDPSVFIVVSPVKKVFGKWWTKTII